MQAATAALVSYLQALSTPAIAFAGIFIAQGQLRLARLNYERSLYERRLKVFEATREALGVLINGSMIASHLPLQALNKFKLEAAECIFLFNDDLIEYLDDIKIIAWEYWQLNTHFERLSAEPDHDSKFAKLRDQENALQRRLQNKIDTLIDVFRPYLAPQRRKRRLWKISKHPRL